MKNLTKTLLPVLLLIGLGYFFYKHSGFFQYDHNPMQFMPNMHRTKALTPQRGYDFFADHSAVRVPPVGSLAKTQKVSPYSKSTAALAVEKYSNPLPIARQTVLRGQKMFMTYCVVCHGLSGLGDGYVVPKFPMPPSLQSYKVRGLADSQIFHIITMGQNSMSSYAPQIREEDRWALIHYLRVLQKSEQPTDADIKAFDDFIKNSKGGQ